MRAIVAVLVTVCLGLLGYIGVAKVAPSILTGLAERADHALAGRFAGVQPVEVDGERRAILTGHVRSAVEKDDVERIVAELDGIASVDNQLVVAEVPAPEPHPAPPTLVGDARMRGLNVVVSWDAGHVTANGQLPGEVAAAFSRALAGQFPSAVLTTDLAPSGGVAPPELEPALEAAARALATAVRGKLELRDDRLTLDAAYASAEGEAAARALVGERIGVLLRTTLSTRIEAAATAEPALAEVAEAVEPSVDAEGGEVDASEALDAEVVDGAELLADADGVEAVDAPIASDVPAEVTAVGDGGPIAPSDAAGVVDPGGALTSAQCKGLIDQLVEGPKRITFKGAKELTPDGDAKVQQVAALLGRCPDAKVTVSGYHDDYGEPDHLQALTGMRANAVFKRLIELGIDKARLKWRGRGYANMRYSTRTQELRLLNQRIEFDIVGAP